MIGRTLLISITLAVFPIMAMADQDRERERLILLAEQMTQIIKTAQAIQQEDAEVNILEFDYPVFITDVTRIRQGIHDYVNRVLDMPREVEPINSQYTQQRLR